MKLKYFYNTTPLGTLEKTQEGYKYTSNVRNEERLREKRILSNMNYSLWNSSGQESADIPPDIMKALATMRGEILERAGVTPEDSIWDVLVKVSRRKTLPSGFYLQEDELTQETDIAPKTDKTEMRI